MIPTFSNVIYTKKYQIFLVHYGNLIKLLLVLYFSPPQQTAIRKQTVMKVTIITTDITLSFYPGLSERRKCFSECQRERKAKRGKDILVRSEGKKNLSARVREEE